MESKILDVSLDMSQMLAEVMDEFSLVNDKIVMAHYFVTAISFGF
jgi:hypothetical protein